MLETLETKGGLRTFENQIAIQKIRKYIQVEDIRGVVVGKIDK